MDLNQLVSYCLAGGIQCYNITGDQTDNTDWLCSQQLWRKEKDENIELTKKKYSIFRLKYYRTVPSRIKCIHTKIPVLLYGSINSQL